MKRILVYRDAFGIGDWIMTLSVMKMLLRCYPDTLLDINLSGKSGVAPKLIVAIVQNFDVCFNRIFCTSNFKAVKENYDVITGHVIYDRRTKDNLMSSMVDTLNRKTGLHVKYISGLYSRYIGPVTFIDVPKKFILMPSCGKDDRVSRHKNWGFENFNELARLLKQYGYNVVQIGAFTDRKLRYADKCYLDLSLSKLHFLMLNCSFFVGLVNGLSVYAGHHSVKTYLLHYNNRLNFATTKYPNQESLDVTELTPSFVLKFVLEKESVKHL